MMITASNYNNTNTIRIIPLPQHCYTSAQTDTQDVKKVFWIMTDQVIKTIKGEESVFSREKNLLLKNLSYEEIEVIITELFPSQYDDVIIVYYKTYVMATQIAESADGERNAKRHAFWMISLVQKFGKSFAVKLTDAHEKGRPGTAEDNSVDAVNNAAALEYVENHPGVDPKQAADWMWDGGCLKGYHTSVEPKHVKL